jgi:hypothetical protein
MEGFYAFPQSSLPVDVNGDRQNEAPHLGPGNPDQATRAQEDLQDGREELLGLRFALRAQRKELSNIRQQTGMLEGVVYNQLSQLLREHGVLFPRQLEDAHERLGALRDRLGFSEVEYDQDEQRYNGLEFKYTQKEGNFIEMLSTTGRAPSMSQNIGKQMIETEYLTRHAGGARDDSDIFGEDQPRNYEPTLSIETSSDSLARKDSPAQGLPTDNLLRARLVLMKVQPHSYSGRDSSTQKTVLPALSESALPQARLDWPATIKRIDSWLRTTPAVCCSRVQKSPLKSFLSQERREDPSWWKLFVKHWNSDPEENVDLIDLENYSLTSRETPTAPASSSSANMTLQSLRVTDPNHPPNAPASVFADQQPILSPFAPPSLHTITSPSSSEPVVSDDNLATMRCADEDDIDRESQPVQLSHPETQQYGPRIEPLDSIHEPNDSPSIILGSPSNAEIGQGDNRDEAYKQIIKPNGRQRQTEFNFKPGEVKLLDTRPVDRTRSNRSKSDPGKSDTAPAHTSQVPPTLTSSQSFAESPHSTGNDPDRLQLKGCMPIHDPIVDQKKHHRSASVLVHMLSP